VARVDVRLVVRVDVEELRAEEELVPDLDVEVLAAEDGALRGSRPSRS
jgi:hypothetical protein